MIKNFRSLNQISRKAWRKFCQTPVNMSRISVIRQQKQWRKIYADWWKIRIMSLAQPGITTILPEKQRHSQADHRCRQALVSHPGILWEVGLQISNDSAKRTDSFNRKLHGKPGNYGMKKAGEQVAVLQVLILTRLLCHYLQFLQMRLISQLTCLQIRKRL